MYVGVLDYFLASFSKLLKRFILNSARNDIFFCGDTRWRSCLKHCYTNQKVAGSTPDCVIGIFLLI
jgi:hypothetical protein